MEFSAAHFDVVGSDTRLNLLVTAKSVAKSKVVLEFVRLKSAEDVERTRALWKQRLLELATLLNPPD